MMNRRRFLGVVISGAGALVLARPGRARAKSRKVAVTLDRVGACKVVGGHVTIELEGRKILLVRDGETSVRALEPTCTHRQCHVAYKPDKGRIECPCHAAAFALDGSVQGGPAPKPLKTYPARIDAEKARIVLTLDEP